jgi:hypothetical protein
MAGQGRAGFDFFQLPTGSVVNEDVNPDTRIDAGKLRHVHRVPVDFGLNEDDTPVAGKRTVFIAATAGRIRAFDATLAEDGTSTDINFDLLVNGASVLSAPVNFADGDGNGVVKSGSFPNEAARLLAVDDVVSVELAVTSATDAEGPFCIPTIDEDAA